MPELPEITSRAREMHQALVGKTISAIEVIQPKSLNLPVEEFQAGLVGGKILEVTNRGKWIMSHTTQGWFLLNLGMGGEILLVTRISLPKKFRLLIDFTDTSCLSINFWWFGYAHFVLEDHLDSHRMSAKLGPNALDLTDERLAELLKGKRGTLKSCLLDQSNLAGIGNAYIHDILFLACLHPLRKSESLTESEITDLYQAIQQALRLSLDKGGAFYEVDIFGKPGGFQAEDILIGYREGKPCPKCGMTIQKIKTGSTSSFVCPNCQVL